MTDSGEQSIDQLLDLDYRVRLSDGSDLGIAVVGCGGIVNYAHLPAYTAHDLNIVGCFDLNPEVAQRTAADFNIPRVYESVEKVANDPDVVIVDVAVPPAGDHVPLHSLPRRAAVSVRRPRMGDESPHSLPGEDRVAGETKTITVLDYEDGLQALVAVNHSNHSDDIYGLVRFLGTEGVITGTMGLSYNYPDGREDTLEWSGSAHYPEHRFEAKLEGKWIPDAFIGPMASLIDAVRDNGVPPTNGRDNLNTLRMVGAAYLSATENRSVRPEEIG